MAISSRHGAQWKVKLRGIRSSPYYGKQCLSLQKRMGRILNSLQSSRTEIHDCHASEHKHLVREVRAGPSHYQDEFSE